MRRLLCAVGGLGLLASSLSLAQASFSFPIPSGTPAASAMALFELSSAYLGSTGSQPFAADPFVLKAYIPYQVSYDRFSRYQPLDFSLNVNGEYINDGVTTLFSNQKLTFVNGTVSAVDFQASNFLTAGDNFSINAYLDGQIFTSSGTGSGARTATFNPGNYAIDPNSDSYANYNGDPKFAGGGASLTTAVPEPGSLALLLTGVLGLALTLSRKRTSSPSAA